MRSNDFWMNLVIDIGNTYFKLAVFSNNNALKFHHDQNKNFESFVLKIFKSFPKIKKTIVSNVSDINQAMLYLLVCDIS